MPIAKNRVSIESPTTPASRPVAAAPTCATRIGFERPSYFFGHLLTDADLTLEQRYLREKKKLQQRTIHGQGIVCGLRLTRDHDDPRSVLIGKGYAIDDCGNDLVLSEQFPLDVVSLLIEKKLILEGSSSGQRHHGKVDPECAVRQTFYVTICYHEEPVDFAAPLVSAGQYASSECEPTRVRETVCLDVVDMLPSRMDASSDLKHRLKSCFKLFTEKEPFGRALKKGQEILNGIINPTNEPHEVAERYNERRKLFFDLYGLLLLYLNQQPDKYNSTIEDDIRKIDFPKAYNQSDSPQQIDSNELRDAFSSLLALAWQHTVSCALGEFVPSWREPSKASCVSLGTVMVENGRVVRVCNCPRSYVWSFANFPEVLLSTTLGALACKKKDQHNSEVPDEANAAEAIGCRDFDFDLQYFLQWLSVNRQAPFYASTELLHWIESFSNSLQEGFDFTYPGNFSARVLEGMHKDKAAECLRAANIQFGVKEPLEIKPVPPATRLQAASLAAADKPMALVIKDDVVTRALVEDPHILTQIDYLSTQIKELKKQLTQLQQQQRPSGGQSAAGPQSAR
jgi:hypothetical protein